MLEFEKKQLLTQTEYECLFELIKNDSVAFLQTNYYYDTEDFKMHHSGITCRIREKNGIFTATVKKHRTKDRECSVEHSKSVQNTQDTTFFGEPTLKLHGTLQTYRIVWNPCEGIEVALDRNCYLDFTDYELEIEYVPAMKREAEELLNRLPIFQNRHRTTCLHNGLNKSARFFARLKSQKGNGGDI